MRLHPAVPVVVVAVLAAGAGGWYFREPLQAAVRQVLVKQGALSQQLASGWLSLTAPPEPPPPPVNRQETAYRWVDAHGVTHFDQYGGSNRKAVVLEPGRVQSADLNAPGSPRPDQP